MRALLTLGVIVIGALVACGDAATPPDGSTGLDAGASPADIPWLAEGTPPIAPPSFTPCPPGWREVTEGEVVHCDPFPEGGALDCPAGEAHFPGEPGCATVGDPCPAGDFAEGLPSDGTVVYVRPGATGGTGSLASPFGALTEVSFSTMPSGTTVALAKGSHAGALPLRAGVRVVGACAAETFLSGVTGPAQAIVTVANGGEPAELRNVTVRTPAQAAVRLDRADGGLRLRGVIVDGAPIFALGVGAGELDAEGIVVESTRDTEPSSGIGLYAVGGRTRIARAVFDDNRYAALYAEGAGTEVSLSDAHVHDTRPDAASGMYARGAYLREGARVDVTRTIFAANNEGVTGVGDGTIAHLEHVVIRGTYRGPMRVGYSLLTGEGARTEGARILIDDAHDSGVIVDAATLSLSDLVIRDVSALESGEFEGVGIQVGGGTADVTRAVIERTTIHGVFVGRESRATLTDVLVRDVRIRARDEVFGRGIGVQGGSVVAVDRVRIERASEVAIFAVDPNTDVTLTDVVVRDTTGRPTTGDFGRGLVAQEGARVAGSRLLVDRSREAGILASLDATISLREVVVSDTLSNTCETGYCADTPFGYGVAGLLTGSVELTGFVVRETEVCGIFLAAGSHVMLADGEVRGAAIGACIQDDAYDLARLTSGVAYRDNGTNLESTRLPVPEPITASP